MRVLIACEFSGVVRESFKVRGHDAWSCDLLPTEIPGQHIQQDAVSVAYTLGYGWDIMICFPPCTHLCSSGAVYWPEKKKDGRQQQAFQFCMDLMNAPISKIAMENPVGILSKWFRKPDQIIHPYHFGEPYMKRTCLWLKNIPKLVPSDPIAPIMHWHGGSRRGGIKKDGTRTPSKLRTALKYGWKERSRTFQGIAEAMAEQWGKL